MEAWRQCLRSFLPRHGRWATELARLSPPAALSLRELHFGEAATVALAEQARVFFDAKGRFRHRG